MGIAYHNLYAADGQILNVADRAYFGTVTIVYTSTSGTATGTAVVVTWTEPVPTPYCVLVSPIEQMTWWITAKTTLGFTFNYAGLVSLSGGSLECLVVS